MGNNSGNESGGENNVVIIDWNALGLNPDGTVKEYETKVLELPPAGAVAAEQTHILETEPNGSPAQPTPSKIQARANVLAHLARLPNLTNSQKVTVAQQYPNGWETGIKQSPDVGNCYFVAPLVAARRNPFFPYLVAASSIPGKDNSSQLRVRLLGSTGGNTFINPQKDLLPQMLLGRVGTWNHLTGEVGDQILEEAYARRRSEEADHRGNMVPLAAMHSGFAGDALKMLYGKYATILEAYVSGGTVLAQTDAKYLQARDYLHAMAESPDEYIGVASTGTATGSPYTTPKADGSPLHYHDADYFFPENHSYSIIHVDEDSEMVTLADPTDSDGRRKTLSFRELCECCMAVSVAKLNRQRIKHDFPDYSFESSKEKTTTREGIYEAPLIPLETYCFEFPQDNELLRISIRTDLFITVRAVKGTTPTAYTASACYEDDTSKYSQPTPIRLGIIREPINVGSKLLSEKSFSGTALARLLPEHIVLGMSAEGITVRSNSLEDAVIVEGDDFTQDEPLSLNSQPGKLNEYLPQGGAVRSFNLQKLSTISLHFVGVNGTNQDGTPHYEFMPYPIVSFSGISRNTHITVESAPGQTAVLGRLTPGETIEIGKITGAEALNQDYISAVQLTAKLGLDGKLYLHNSPKYSTYVS